MTELAWSSWGSQTADGSGLYTENTCNPDCAAGNLASFAVSVELSNPGDADGHRVFTSMSVHFTGQGSAYEAPKDFTITVPGSCPAMGGTDCSAPPSPGAWNAQVISMTDRSLGNVTLGMTLAQASAAAGVPLTVAGNGLAWDGTDGSPEAAFSGGNGSGVTVYLCGVSHAVGTPEGFSVGDTVQDLKALYGTLLTYVPAGPGHGAPGYVLHLVEGNIVFWPSHDGATITSMASGIGVTPAVGC